MPYAWEEIEAVKRSMLVNYQLLNCLDSNQVKPTARLDTNTLEKIFKASLVCEPFTDDAYKRTCIRFGLTYRLADFHIGQTYFPLTQVHYLMPFWLHSMLKISLIHVAAPRLDAFRYGAALLRDDDLRDGMFTVLSLNGGNVEELIHSHNIEHGVAAVAALMRTIRWLEGLNLQTDEKLADIWSITNELPLARNTKNRSRDYSI